MGGFLTAVLYARFGEMLSQARKKKHVSQEALAHELGLSRTSITNIERGRQPVQLHTLYKAAAFLGVDIAQLLPSLETIEQPVSEPAVSLDNYEWLERMDVKVTPARISDEQSNRSRAKGKRASGS